MLMPDGTLVPMRGFALRRRTQAASEATTAGPTALPADVQMAQQALSRIGPPDTAYVASVRDGIWLRRKAYFHARPAEPRLQQQKARHLLLNVVRGKPGRNRSRKFSLS